MNKRVKILALTVIASLSLVGCSATKDNDARVMRVAHNQGEEHPIHLALKKFEEIVENKTNNEIDIQVYPNELLGGQRESVELTQTGAIDIAVGSISLLESFEKAYSVFNLPYLFDSTQHYHEVMNDKDIMDDIYQSTKESGFVALTWFDAGSRNMYTTDKPIMKPEDLKGKKIRVQQSQTNIKMMDLLGGSATPMSFGEVYTALQQKVIDGAENNELALTNNKHGEVAKHYSYNKHAMIPDILIMNAKLLDDLSDEHRKIILDAADEINKFEIDAWEEKVNEAVEQSKAMGVNFHYPDIEPFKEKVLPLHEEMTQDEEIKVIYDKIQQKSPKESKN